MFAPFFTKISKAFWFFVKEARCKGVSSFLTKEKYSKRFKKIPGLYHLTELFPSPVIKCIEPKQFSHSTQPNAKHSNQTLIIFHKTAPKKKKLITSVNLISNKCSPTCFRYSKSSWRHFSYISLWACICAFDFFCFFCVFFIIA